MLKWKKKKDIKFNPPYPKTRKKINQKLKQEIHFWTKIRSLARIFSTINWIQQAKNEENHHITFQKKSNKSIIKEIGVFTQVLNECFQETKCRIINIQKWKFLTVLLCTHHSKKLYSVRNAISDSHDGYITVREEIFVGRKFLEFCSFWLQSQNQISFFDSPIWQHVKFK